MQFTMYNYSYHHFIVLYCYYTIAFIIKRREDLADVHDIHKRIDQSDFTARFPGSADIAF